MKEDFCKRHCWHTGVTPEEHGKYEPQGQSVVVGFVQKCCWCGEVKAW